MLLHCSSTHSHVHSHEGPLFLIEQVHIDVAGRQASVLFAVSYIEASLAFRLWQL